MSDIVERLCFLPLVHRFPVGVADVTSDAATEITRLRAQLTGRIEDIRVQEETILAVRKERDALRAQVAALEGDAGRYRWLRDKLSRIACNVNPGWEAEQAETTKIESLWVMEHFRATDPESTDAAIDAARGAT